MVARGRSKNAPTGLIVVLKFVCRGGVSPPDFLGPPRTSTPTDLIVFLKFVCRGGYYPPALPNAMSPKAFPCEGLLSQATVEFALQTSRGPLAVDE